MMLIEICMPLIRGISGHISDLFFLSIVYRQHNQAKKILDSIADSLSASVIIIMIYTSWETSI